MHWGWVCAGLRQLQHPTKHGLLCAAAAREARVLFAVLLLLMPLLAFWGDIDWANVTTALWWLIVAAAVFEAALFLWGGTESSFSFFHSSAQLWCCCSSSTGAKQRARLVGRVLHYWCAA